MNKVGVLAKYYHWAKAIPLARVPPSFSFSTGFDTQAWEAEYSPDKARQLFSKFSDPAASIRLRKDEASGCGEVTIDNKAGKNALNGGMFIELEQIVGELNEWRQGRLVVLSGANGTFCSGGDLHMMKQIANPKDGFTMNRYMSEILRNLRNIPQLSVAKLEGFALGGGSELAMACDLRAAKRNAKFGYVQSKISVTPGWGTTGRLFETVGRAKALEMLALGSLLTADQAKDLGLVNLVFDKDEDFAGWIQRFIRMDVDVIRSVKRLGIIYGSNSNDSNSNSMGEREVFARNWGSPAHLRALEAGRKMK